MLSMTLVVGCGDDRLRPASSDGELVHCAYDGISAELLPGSAAACSSLAPDDPLASGRAASAILPHVDPVLLDEVVQTDYGQFDLTWSSGGGFDGDYDRFFAGQENGLVGAADPDGLYLNLARRSGGSRVRIVLRRAAPADPEAEWQDVVEVSTTIPVGADPQWASWAGETGGGLHELEPGNYRVRFGATGRDAGAAGEVAEGVVDEYLIELWPEPSGRDDVILRSGSRDAEYWHQEVGRRR